MQIYPVSEYVLWLGAKMNKYPSAVTLEVEMSWDTQTSVACGVEVRPKRYLVRNREEGGGEG